jgi:ketosteroid isomerase-like protein
MTSTREVLDHHLKCLAAGDLEGIVTDYASDAVLITPPGFFAADGILRGPAGAAEGFRSLLDEFGKPGASFEIKETVVDGDYAYIVWRADTPTHLFDFGSDTFVIRNGKIVAQTFAGKIARKA